jgi:hypothetical protein
MKFLNSRKQKVQRRTSSLNPISVVDLYAIQGSTLSIDVEITRHPLSVGPLPNRESRLRVKISNVGAAEIDDLSVEATTPDGALIIDPGMLFGTSRRHVRLPRLLPNKSITYKLGLRASEYFQSGTLLIVVKETSMISAGSQHQIEVALNTSP